MEYSVIITPNASRDLTDIRNYIAVKLNEPATASVYIQEIKNAIISLDQMPSRFKLCEEAQKTSPMTRRMLVKKFYVYFLVDESNKIVYVQNVIYCHRDQQALIY